MRRGFDRPPRSPEDRANGFTLVEMMVAMLILVLILVGVMSLFSFSSKLARAQVQIAGAQQSLRVTQDVLVRNARMAGRGGLPRGLMPAGLAVSVRNDVPASGDQHHIAVADTNSPEVVEGTDVLTVRGVFSSPLFQVASGGADFVLNDPANPTSGYLTVHGQNPRTEMPQDLSALQAAVDDSLPVALILMSPVDSRIYAVVELNPTGPNTVSGDTAVTVDFQITGGTYADQYRVLSPGGVFPPGLQTISSVGILEEVRYYIREEYAVPGDKTTELVPRLSQALFYPGTEVALGADSANLQLDVADDVIDLQLALGIDRNGDQIVIDDGSGTDDWLFNSTDDDATESEWNLDAAGTGTPPLFYLRLSSLSRTHRRDLAYLDGPRADIEDHAYSEGVLPADDAERQARMFRRRFAQTTVDLRNVL